MKNKSLEGGCICGQVRYKLTEKPLFTQACHCKDCKILTGSSYVINSSVLENTLLVEGNVSSSVELKGIHLLFRILLSFCYFLMF